MPRPVVVALLLVALGLVSQVDPPAADRPVPKDGPGPEMPAWAMDARWYHVVVPRFDNGSTENDPVGHPENGGDLQGLTRRLPYLKELGINTLYLSHLFVREGRHPHERWSFGRVDESLRDPGRPTKHEPQSDAAGGAGPGEGAKAVQAEAGEAKAADAPTARTAEQVLTDFVRVAHAQGFRVILEGPCTLQPHENPGAAEWEKLVIGATKRWLDPDGDGKSSDGVDGWVIQDPQPLPSELWRRWRDTVKKLNPDALLVVDAEGDLEKWLTGETFDTFVNRGLVKPIEQLFSPAEKSYPLEKFAAEVSSAFRSAAPERQRAAPTTLGGPHSGRLRSIVERQIRGSEGQGPSPGATAAGGPRRAQLATMIQFFAPGAPMMYYGDEILLPNSKDQNSLTAMRWNSSPAGGPRVNSPQEDLTPLIQWLGLRRGVDKPLRDGTFEVVQVDEARKLLVLGRAKPGDEVLLVLNLGEEKQSVALHRGKPGNYVGFITPQLDPKELAPRMSPPKPPAGGVIAPLRIAGSRQFMVADGRFELWVDPMYARIALLQFGAP